MHYIRHEMLGVGATRLLVVLATSLLPCVDGLRLAAARSPSLHRARAAAVRCCGAADEAQTTTLKTLLSELKPLGPIRAIVVMPGASSILESIVDSSRWTLNEKQMPSGKTLLTAALPDDAKSFELHMDTAVATKATLGYSPKTQGPVVRVLDSDGAGLLTLLPSKAKAAEFDAVIEQLGGELALVPTPVDTS